jgi:uncharacterized phage protein (TIGR01671 family)
MVKEEWKLYLNGGVSICDTWATRDVELMQYTGLLDKNGKEIYERDILGGTWGDGYIDYCEKCKSFEYFMKVFGCANCSGDISWQEVVEDNGKLEVIGNVFENPELLEVK